MIENIQPPGRTADGVYGEISGRTQLGKVFIKSKNEGGPAHLFQHNDLTLQTLLGDHRRLSGLRDQGGHIRSSPLLLPPASQRLVNLNERQAFV